MAFLSGWSYRKPVTLSRASGAVTNYQMKLKVGESSGATGEDVDCGGLCKTDFSDLRFTAADGTTLLDYYIEDVSGATPNQLATVWIEFDSIGTGATTFYMYYGNAGAAAVSNGPNTFILFEDFNALNDGDLTGQNGWVAGGAGSADIDVTTTVKYEGAKGLLSANGATNVSVKKTVPGTIYNYFLQARMRATSVAAGNVSDIYFREGGNQITGIALSAGQMVALVTPTAWVNIGKAVSANTWYKAAIAIDSTTKHSTWVDDTKYSPANDNNLTTIASKIDEIMLEHYSPGGTVYWDQILICKFYTTGPTWGSWGAQEAALQHYSMSLDAGAFGLTGSPVSLMFDGLVKMDPAVYSMVGKSLGIFHGYPPFVLEGGAFSMSGSGLTSRFGNGRMNLESGSFVVTGTPLDPFYSWYRGESSMNYQFAKQRRNF